IPFSTFQCTPSFAGLETSFHSLTRQPFGTPSAGNRGTKPWASLFSSAAPTGETRVSVAKRRLSAAVGTRVMVLLGRDGGIVAARRQSRQLLRRAVLFHATRILGRSDVQSEASRPTGSAGWSVGFLHGFAASSYLRNLRSLRRRARRT